MKTADVSTPHGWRISVFPTGKASIGGVDAGPKLTFHGESKQHLVLKMGGHNAWCGRGQQAYYPGRFYVFEIQTRKDLKTHVEYNVVPLVDFTIKQTEETKP